MRFLGLVLAIAVASTGASQSVAAPCKDAKGKFVKCPTVAPAGARCRKDGKFAKCGTPGAVLVKR